jgi:hypothetical protein
MDWEKKLDFGEMYRKLMEETKEYNQDLNGVQGAYLVPKWKKDLLIFLLMKSKEKPCPVKTKYLRRVVNLELDRELDSK